MNLVTSQLDLSKAKLLVDIYSQHECKIIANGNRVLCNGYNHSIDAANSLLKEGHIVQDGGYFTRQNNYLTF